ncbi:MAG: helix-turn-helix transcriptional regulator [Clostridia bacterium]|nr:helix-turn-helix transcriptional regulator [Clostridiales bacterium]MBQ7917904.1 helix-turn-helix transcriptional regulator [Clostridia bacterium]
MENVIGKSIKERRLEHKYSQQALADKIGVTHASISYWENGVNIPNVLDVWKIADVLNISIDELVGRT